MMGQAVIVTGGSQGIGAGLVSAFLGHGYNVAGNSLNGVKSGAFEVSDKLAWAAGSMAEPATAAKIDAVATGKFGSIDAPSQQRRHIFLEAFTGCTLDDLQSLVSGQYRGLSPHHPAGDQADVGSEARRKHRQYHVNKGGSSDRRSERYVPMMTKGGLEAATGNLAMEYAKHCIRVNAVAPGTIAHGDAQGSVGGVRLQPIGQIVQVNDIYLTDAAQATGEVLHVDGGA